MVGPPPDSWAVEPADASARELAPGLWRLRLPLPWIGIPAVNAFALAGADGGVVLVDCGSAGDETLWDALVVALRGAGFAPADVRRVVLTHYHSDHVGLVARLVEESGCEVLGHPAIEHFTDGTLRPDAIYAARERRGRAEGCPEGLLLDAVASVGEEVVGVLEPLVPTPIHDGDTVDSALGPWTVIETPGHAPSHICLHQPERRLLILGDVLAPAFYPYYDYGYSPDPIAEYFLTIERLEALGEMELALPGHGRPLDDLAGTLAGWRDAIRAQLEASEAAVAAGAKTGWEVALRVCEVDVGDPMSALFLAEVVTYLKHLRRAGRIVRRVGADGAFRYAPADG